jgi:hypothetical protein
VKRGGGMGFGGWHFLEMLDERSRLNVEFVSFREQLDTAVSQCSVPN